MEQQRNQQVSEEKHTEPDLVFKKVVFNGDCDHYWIQEEDSIEGYGVVHCEKCPMGRHFQKKEWKVEDGRIITK